MATIITRAGKGTPLTNTELDANFTNLNTALADYLPLAGGTVTGLVSITTASLATPFELVRNSTQNIGGKFANTSYTTFFGLGQANGELRVGTSADLQGAGNIVLHAANYSGYAQPADADLTAIAALAGTTGILKKTAANTWSLDTSAYLTGITSGQVTTALGFTPYNSTNPNGYTTNTGTVTGVTATGPVVSSGGTAPVISMAAATTSVAGYLTAADWNTFNGKQAALGFTPYNSTNPSGYITGITSGNVTAALGFTPYNSTNPSGYITSSGSISGNAATATSLTSSNFIVQKGSGGSWNADFQNTPAGATAYNGDVGANGTNGPGGSWWIQQNFRHTNTSNYWGTQVAWGWEDNANRLATRNITGGVYGGWVYYLNSSNFSSYAVPLRGQTNWDDSTVIDDVIGLMAWKNYGNSHVIFDASNSTTPSGRACNNTNPEVNWAGSYPTLMGWNGDSTYGLRVDSSRLSDRSSRANGNFYIDDNFGCGVVGTYAPTRYQGVFFMGDSYKMSADGTSLANMYGMAWSHPNAGGAAGNLTDHGLLIINNGVFRCAISNSIVASGSITAYSDERLKTNWRDMPENFVARLAQVKVGIYDRLDEEDVTQVGVSAQSFQELLPQAIMTAKDEMSTLSVSYGNAALASAVELAKDNVELRARIERLEALVEKLIGG